MDLSKENLSNLRELSRSYIITNDGEKLLFYKLVPNNYCINSLKETLILIPGFCAILTPWKKMISGLLELGYPLIIFETREKVSSTATKDSDRYSMEGYQKDLEDFFQQIPIKQPFSIIGISLGSGIVIRHVVHNKSEKHSPRKIILIDAIYTAKHFNRMIKLSFQPFFVFKLTIKLLLIFAPIIMSKIRKEDNFLYKKRLNTLKKAELSKMRIALQSAKGNSIEFELGLVNKPTLVIGIENDNEHPIEQAIKIAQSIPRSKFIFARDNIHLHDFLTAANIVLFLQEN